MDWERPKCPEHSVWRFLHCGRGLLKPQKSVKPEALQLHSALPHGVCVGLYVIYVAIGAQDRFRILAQKQGRTQRNHNQVMCVRFQRACPFKTCIQSLHCLCESSAGSHTLHNDAHDASSLVRSAFSTGPLRKLSTSKWLGCGPTMHGRRCSRIALASRAEDSADVGVRAEQELLLAVLKG